MATLGEIIRFTARDYVRDMFEESGFCNLVAYMFMEYTFSLMFQPIDELKVMMTKKVVEKYHSPWCDLCKYAFENGDISFYLSGEPAVQELIVEVDSKQNKSDIF